MANGDGSIIARGRGVWEVQLSFGKDPITGKYRKATRTVHGTKAEARKVRDKMKADHDNGLRIDSGKVTFREFAATWTEARRTAGTANERTIEKDAQRLEFVCSFIGDVPMNAIDAQAIESLYAAIKARRIEQGYSFGNTTMRSYHVLIKSVFKKAVNYDLILRNPCDRVEAPKADDPERRSLAVDEGARLLRCIDEAEAAAYRMLDEKEARQTERGNLFGRTYLRGLSVIGYAMTARIGLATGVRLSEPLLLIWKYVDLDQSCIFIVKAKTKAGVRRIALDSKTVEHLRMWKTRQAVELLKIGVRQSDATPVVCSARGTFCNVWNFEHWWNDFRERNGFSDLKYHELRHTQATQLLANGVDVKTVQTRLGHSDPSLTLKWYAHALPENDEKAAHLVGELFSTEPEKPRIIEVKTA
ncbi:tyrosine-type recombinase/integrase [Arabiibacter massiliensis]|uniref:tyrosine-type recombinase/integrase n=1 Tax=Arabiibacter massiliensis TaxID=1870985 RepID=UPI0009BAE329|nr:tyrosine-type recombinase/integrase [Arabiibacter massiliensis]